jgi:hypothetical protein
LYISLLSHPCCISLSSHSPWFVHPISICDEYKLWSFSLRNFLHPPVTPPYVLIISQHFVLNNPTLCSSLPVTDQISDPYN